jgi:uncharacterized protein (TIGR02271 family)
MAEHIVAVFETETAAAAAEQSLQSAGIPAAVIRRYASSEIGREEVAPLEHTSTHTGGGFWSWLFGEEPTSETTRSAYTHDVYDRRAAAGNVVVSVVVDDDTKIHQAIAALEAHNPVDIDERSDEMGGAATASAMASATGPATVRHDFTTGDVAQAGLTDTAVTSGRVGVTGAPAALSNRAGMPAAGLPENTAPVTTRNATVDARSGEQVIPLSEEQLDVGKRTVDRGTTRVRRYVVEKPVEENVTLRGERMTVERRQPIETTTAPGMGAFEERVVEVREAAEEPVVAKTARVVEEVVIGREATERTETVKDTVRREEVEVAKDDEVKR